MLPNLNVGTVRKLCWNVGCLMDPFIHVGPFGERQKPFRERGKGTGCGECGRVELGLKIDFLASNDFFRMAE